MAGDDKLKGESVLSFNDGRRRCCTTTPRKCSFLHFNSIKVGKSVGHKCSFLRFNCNQGGKLLDIVLGKQLTNFSRMYYSLYFRVNLVRGSCIQQPKMLLSEKTSVPLYYSLTSGLAFLRAR
jgi:hypothetical protein